MFRPVRATALYSYVGENAEELPFTEGDTLSIVDRSDGDWWKAEKDGVIFIVPAAYLEIEG
jgi:actin cytoskeleton-regulatory complex protein PAN1